jgi:hypothetical protein
MCCTLAWIVNLCALWHGVRTFVHCDVDCKRLCTMTCSANIYALWHGVRMFVHCEMECKRLCIVTWSANVCALWYEVRTFVHCDMERERLCTVTWSANVCALRHGVQPSCLVWVVRCLQWCTWGLWSSGMWHWITGFVAPDILQEFIYRGPSHMSIGSSSFLSSHTGQASPVCPHCLACYGIPCGAVNTWRWRQHIPFEHLEPLSKWYSFMPRETGICVASLTNFCVVPFCLSSSLFVLLMFQPFLIYGLF